MKILDPGHLYKVETLDGAADVNLIQFVKRIGEKYPGNSSSYAGTTVQELLRCCIDRLKYLDQQISDWRNSAVIGELRNAIYLLEWRAADRHGRKISSKKIRHIEEQSTCKKCLHIGCMGECH